MKILAIIPARSGSKGIPDKNIRLLNGTPLLVYSIQQALASRFKMRVVVSTDSEQYAKIARAAGAETPFLRPASISQDLSTDLEVFQHALDWLARNEAYYPDIVVHLRPTYPTRTVQLLDQTLQSFIEALKDGYTSLRTVVQIEKSPFKMYLIEEEDNKEGQPVLQPLFKEYNGIKEPYNQCRQILPTSYLHNGCIDILKTDIIQKGTVSGDKIFPFIMSSNETHDIDTVEDFNKAKSSSIVNI